MGSSVRLICGATNSVSAHYPETGAEVPTSIGITTTRLQVRITPSSLDVSPELRAYAVTDVVVHPNQGELISCDQMGRIKQWDLSENICTHELASFFRMLLHGLY